MEIGDTKTEKVDGNQITYELVEITDDGSITVYNWVRA